ncbi:MAG: uridine phosphorylase [Oscillospiraceae bacterium]|nr:uridine phosphorylase [Oscillospiraceae bacterium]
MPNAQYHLGFADASGARYAILPGDPGRVQGIAEKLDNPRFHAQNREYTAWMGEAASEPVLVMSTGMGGPSTAIAVEELAQLGVDTFIRVGTCGGMAEKVNAGDLVIATGAIRQEGTSREYIPIEFPAIASIDVTNALIQAAKNTNLSWHAGVVQCKDSFYGQHCPERMPVSYELKNKWQAWIKAGCLASEMESAALYIVAQTLCVRAGCILSVVWNQENAAKGLCGKEVHDTSHAIAAAVEAVRILIKSGANN